MKEAIEQDPTNAVLYFNIGVVNDKKGDKTEAIKYYKNAHGARSHPYREISRGTRGTTGHDGARSCPVHGLSSKFSAIGALFEQFAKVVKLGGSTIAHTSRLVC